MLSRRNRRTAQTGGVAGIISRNPRETVGLFAASAAFMIIFVNALFLQPGPHPAPIFAPRPAAHAAAPQPVPLPAPAPAVETPAHPRAGANEAPQPKAVVKSASSTHADPIAQLIAPSKQVLAVQRVLAAYGYGQIRQTGILGPETQEAIRKFERNRKMPVTGMISEPLLRALGELSGQSLD